MMENSQNKLQLVWQQRIYIRYSEWTQWSPWIR